MDNPPFVSIVVLNWNGERYLAECLESLLAQTYPNYEMIVVDNGSTDASVELLKGYLPRIKLILNKDNLGFAAGNNVAIKEAAGEFIVLFNNDAVAHSEWLERLIAGTLTPPQAGIAGGPTYFYDHNDVIWSAGLRTDMLTGIGWQLGMFQHHLEPTNDIDYLAGCALLVRKEVFDAIGLLDERFFFYTEDLDFCLRAKRAGFILRLVPDAKVSHMVSKPLKQKPTISRYRKFQSEFTLIFKSWPLWCLPLTLFLQLTLIPIAYVFLFGYPLSHPIVAWRAFFSVLAEVRRNGFRRDYSKDLPLRVRTLECLRVAGQRLRMRAQIASIMGDVRKDG